MTLIQYLMRKGLLHIGSVPRVEIRRIAGIYSTDQLSRSCSGFMHVNLERDSNHYSPRVFGTTSPIHGPTQVNYCQLHLWLSNRTTDLYSWYLPCCIIRICSQVILFSCAVEPLQQLMALGATASPSLALALLKTNSVISPFGSNPSKNATIPSRSRLYQAPTRFPD